jgi:hypothetical protein
MFFDRSFKGFAGISTPTPLKRNLARHWCGYLKTRDEIAKNVLDLMQSTQKPIPVSLVYFRSDGAREYHTKDL